MNRAEEHASSTWLALVDESQAVRAAMRSTLIKVHHEVIEAVVEGIRGGRKIILIGNGGSAADAQHIAAELVGRFRLERAAWPALALSENISSLTGIGNDYSHDMVFSRQLDALGMPGDVLIALSTSGTSPSVLRAAESARANGLKLIGISGSHANPLLTASDIAVGIPAPTTASIQEGYMLFLHAVCQVVEELLAAD